MTANSAVTFSGTICVAADHPSLPGHFPGNPIVPGVLLLDRIGDLLQQWQPNSRIAGIAQAKFHRLLRPEQQITVTLCRQKPHNISFECLHGPEKIASGVFLVETTA